MPQFDKVTFCTQLFWTISLFIFWYMLTVRNYLPLFVGLLKLRNKRINSTFVDKLNEEPKLTKDLRKKCYQSLLDYTFLQGNKLSRKISENLAKDITMSQKEATKFSNKTFVMFYKKGENQKSFLQ